jgi:hypothetical protein
VLRIFSRLNVGGPSVHVILLTAGLRDRGYETRLVVGSEEAREGDLVDLAVEKGIELHRVAALGREIRPLSDFRAFWALLGLMRRFRPAVVHTHTAKAGFLGRLAARLSGVPVVVHTFHGHVLQGYFGPWKSALFTRIERLLARSTDALVAVSDAVKQDLVALRVAPAEKIRVARWAWSWTACPGPWTAATCAGRPASPRRRRSLARSAASPPSRTSGPSWLLRLSCASPARTSATPSWATGRHGACSRNRFRGSDCPASCSSMAGAAT